MIMTLNDFSFFDLDVRSDKIDKIRKDTFYLLKIKLINATYTSAK